MQRQITNPIGAFQGSSKLGLLIALGLAIATGVVIYTALQSEDSAAGPSGPAGAVPIVAAAESIPAGTRISSGMLEITQVSEDAVLDGTARSFEQVVGSIARIPIIEGEPILTGKLTVDSTVGSGLRFVVPEGRRAVGVRVDKVIGAGGLLRPGDRVDVFAIVEVRAINPISGEPTDGEDRAITLAQNIEVLAVEQELLRVLPGQGNTERTAESGGALPDQPDPQPTSTVATLALTPEESLLVVGAGDDIRLGLRAPGDDSIATTPTYGYDDVAAAIQGFQNDVRFSSLAFIVPEGHRAMAVQVDKVINAGGLVRPGDHVDLLAVLEVTAVSPDGTETEGLTRAVTLVQNIEVLAVEQALENIETDEAGQAAAQPGAQVVTLALTPQATQAVFLAEEEGTIRLAVRPPGDDAVSPLPATAFFSVLNHLGPAQLLGAGDDVSLLD